MKSGTARLVAAAVALLAGVLLQNPGCANYGLQFATEAFDFCSVLNCESGTFFSLCDPIVLLWDCPIVP